MKQTFKVADMHCSNCAMHLLELEDSLPGVKRVDASYLRQEMVVEYDDRQVTLEQIIAGVKQLGYTAVAG
jgi:copper chaperone CopZ